jgi:hypothetical protein
VPVSTRSGYWRGGLLAGVVTAGLSACGPNPPTGNIEKTVPAGGVLTYRDQPLEFYQVTFYPEGHRPAAGTTDEQGKFVLGTNSVGDGAVAGTHRVAVMYVGPPSTNPEEGMNEFSAPPPPKVKTPAKYRDVKTSNLTVEVPASGSTDLKVVLE